MLSSKQLRPSPTLAINELSARLAKEGRTIRRLGFGQSPFPPPAHVVEALRENAWRRDYLAVQGLAELREAAAGFHRQRYGMTVTGDDLLIGPGSKELIFLLQLVYGGELLLPSPSWVSYAPQAHLLGGPVRWLPTAAEDRWRLDPDVLDRCCSETSTRPRMLILNYPSNPTGVTLDEERLEALAAVVRKHRLLVVSDEIYGEFHHQGQHVSISRYYPEGTIVTGGLSKWCGAGGWRVGVMCFPRELRELLAATCCAASETYSGVNSPAQYAGVTAYAAGSAVETYLTQARRILAALGRWVWSELNAAGIETAEPDGAFYIFPDFSSHGKTLRVETSAGLCRELLLQANVVLLPGSDFGRDPSDLVCRLAYVDFDGRAALEAAALTTGVLDVPFLKTHCAGVVAGVDAIMRWVRQPVEVGA